MTGYYQKFLDYKSQNEEYLKGATLDGAYYLGNHYTDKELRILQRRGQAPSVVNYAYSTIYTQMSIMLANDPQWRAIGRDDNDQKKAALVNDMFAYIYYVNSGKAQVRSAVEDMLVFGRGQLGFWWDPMADDGFGEIKFESIPINEVYWDPKAQKRFGEDSEYVFRRKVMSTTTALAYFPEFAGLIRNARATGLQNASNFLNPMPTQNGTMWGVDAYQRGSESLQLIEVIEAFSMEYPILYDLYSMGQPVARDLPAAQLQSAYAYLYNQGARIDSALRKRKPQCRRTLLFGAQEAGSDIMPIEGYPIVPVMNMYTGNLFPFGDIRQIRPLIDEVNKLRSLRLVNLATSPHGKMIYRKGLFDNEKTIEDDLSRPGAALGANTASEDIKKDIMILSPTAVHPENFSHEQITQANISQISGVYEMQQGGTADAPDTFRATLAFDEFAQRKLRYKLSNVEMALAYFGRLLLQLAQQKYPPNKVMRIVEPTWNSQDEAVRYQRINVPVFDSYGTIISYYNDVRTGKYDVVVAGGSSMPVNRWAQQQAYKEDYQLGLIDDIEYLKKADIYDRQGVIERKSLYVQQKQQLDQLTQMVQQLQADNDKLAKAKEDLQKKVELTQVQGDYKLALQELEQEAKTKLGLDDVAIAKAGLEVETAKREAIMTIKEAAHKQKMQQQTKPKKP